MAAKDKKFNRPAGIVKRDKESHAQYVWIREMFLRQDKLEKRIGKLEETVKFIRDEINKIQSEGNKNA